MNPLGRNPLQSRRGFFDQVARAAQAVGVSGALTQLATTQAADRKPTGEPNPFAYDVDRLRHTDPKLIQYREVARFASPRPEPRRLAMAPSGHLFLAAGSYLLELKPDGSLVREMALAAEARCVAVDADGLIYAGLRDHVEVLNGHGAKKAAWAVPAPKSYVTGLAVSKDAVFVADAGQRLVLRYDRSGQLVKTIGKRDAARNVPGFIVPSPFFDVEMASDGLLRVTNPGRHRVELYTTDGEFELHWGQASMGITGFCGCCNPINLALLPDGRYVTVEKGLPRVKIHASDGQFESVVAGCESFAENAKACGPQDCSVGGLDAAVDAKGRIYILDLVAANIRVMEKNPA